MIGKLKKFLLGAVCASMCLGMVACGGTEDPGNNPGGTTGGNTNPPEPEPVKIEEPFDINNEEHINWYGRTYVESIRSGGGSHGGGGSSTEGHFFNHTASGFEVTFMGTSLSASFYATNPTSEWNVVLTVFVDGEQEPRKGTTVSLDEARKNVDLASGLENGLHTVKVLKRSEAQNSANALLSLTTDGDFYTPPEKPERKLEFYGDSLTAGVGITATEATGDGSSLEEDGLATYAGIAARFFNAQYNVFAGGGRALYLSQYHSRSIYDMYRQVDFDVNNQDPWDFDSYIPDAVVINLGTNDSNYVYNMCKTEAAKEAFYTEYKKVYEKFVTELHQLYPNAHIVAVYNMAAGEGSYLHKGFEEFINDLAVSKNLPLTVLKFAAMQDNPGDIRLDHPGPKTHEICGDLLVEHLKEVLGW